jgi:hypothetical protein
MFSIVAPLSCPFPACYCMRHGDIGLMLAHLRARRGLRTFVACLAAYVVALQMVLAAVLAPTMALAAANASTFNVICHSESGDGGAAGPAMPLHNVCAVCVQAHATPGADGVRVTPRARSVVYTLAAEAAHPLPSAQRTHTPRLSQGPPRDA